MLQLRWGGMESKWTDCRCFRDLENKDTRLGKLINSCWSGRSNHITSPIFYQVWLVMSASIPIWRSNTVIPSHPNLDCFFYEMFLFLARAFHVWESEDEDLEPFQAACECRDRSVARYCCWTAPDVQNLCMWILRSQMQPYGNEVGGENRLVRLIPSTHLCCYIIFTKSVLLILVTGIFLGVALVDYLVTSTIILPNLGLLHNIVITSVIRSSVYK